MNQETSDKIKGHLERQAEAHLAALLLANTNPQLGKLYREYWQPIHMVIAAVTFLAVLAEHDAVKPRLLSA